MESQAAAPQAEQGATLSEGLIWKALKNVYDPELPVNIVDLGLVYSCAISAAAAGGKSVAIRMGVTAPGCGMSNVLKSDVETKVRRLPEVTEADVQVVFDPPWSPARMSEAARLQLGFDLDGGGPQLTQIGPIR
jgi:metal-sulfur cluster biosynthetic enzyme